MNSEQRNIIRLFRSENIGIKTFFSLIAFFKSATKSLEHIETMSLKGERKKPIKIYSNHQLDLELESLNQIGGKNLLYSDHNYPKLLKLTHDYPPILTYIGNIELLQNKILGVVGARNASILGCKIAKNIVTNISKANITIVSGMARGMDTIAHQSSLPNTIAILAGGLDHIYPRENTKLYHQIKEEGLLLSENPIGTTTLTTHFPRRNRLIAGMSSGVLLIEAAKKSGSMLTADYAIEYNRPLFVVPGSPLDPRNLGSNKLISEGACLTQTYEDILNNFPDYFDNHKFNLADKKVENNMNNINYESITDKMRTDFLNAVSDYPVSIDEITQYIGVSIELTQIIAIEFELSDTIIRNTDNKIILNHKT